MAPLAIARRMQLPKRLAVILEGEGLANDATALILYRFAIAAVSASTFSFGRAVGMFAAIPAAPQGNVGSGGFARRRPTTAGKFQQMKPHEEPPPIPSNWKRMRPSMLMMMGRHAHEMAQPFLERLTQTAWVGQNEVDPPVAGRSVESATQQGAFYIMLNVGGRGH